MLHTHFLWTVIATLHAYIGFEENEHVEHPEQAEEEFQEIPAAEFEETKVANTTVVDQGKPRFA